MASPVFLSSRWLDDGPRLEVEELDRQLRLRGVPVLRDVRELGAGGLNEDEAWRAITEVACGLVLYFSADVLKSWFINSVELRAVRDRLKRDGFFVAAVFDGLGSAEIDRLRTETGVDVRAFQGLDLKAGEPAADQLRPFAAEVLGRYLGARKPPLTASVATRDEIAYEDEAVAHLNWDGLLGDDHTPLDPSGPGELQLAAHDLREQFERCFHERDLVIAGTMHLSAAFLLGWEFRETTGWTIDCEHPRAPLGTEMVAGDLQGFNLALSPSQNDSDVLAVRIAISQDPDGAVRAHRSGEPPARAELVLSPPQGAASKVALDGVDLSALAAAVIEQIQLARTRFGVRSSAIYLACPWTFAVQLGWMFGSLGEAAVFEATPDKTTYYNHAITLP